MRVLMLHNFYQIPGGEDSVVHAELSMLRKNGVEVELFSTTNDLINGRLQQAKAALQVVYNPAARRALARKLAAFRPDVVHVHNFFPLFSPSIFDACLDAGVPSVMTLHNYRILCPTAFLRHNEPDSQRSLRQACWWTVRKKVYRDSTFATLALATMVEFHKRIGTWRRKVDRFIALTDCARRTFTEGGLPAERLVVKPNWVAGPASLGQASRDGALFVGRLDEQKGIRVLLDAWRELDYPLTIIGDGPLAGLIRQAANDRIVWLGKQPRDIVQQAMQSARFLVLPSVGQEMFPLTVLEAYANRLPVVCSALPSLGELVEPDVTGLQFPPADAGALADQVRWAAGNRQALDEFGRQAHDRYLARYTPQAAFKLQMDIYQSVCR